MSRGKYKRKRNHSQRDANQKRPQINIASQKPDDRKEERNTEHCANQDREIEKEKRVSLRELLKRPSVTDYMITLFTLVLAVVSYFQWKEIHDGGKDTHTLSESTLAATRAWVVVQGTGFGFTKDKNFPQGTVVLADSGNSPAFGVDGWRCVEVRRDEPPIQNGQLQRSSTGVCLPVSGGTMGKGVPITMFAFVPANVPPDFSQDTEGTGTHFYYWGIITYDIFPRDGKRHSTSFCLKNGGSQLSMCKEGGYQAD